MTTPSLRAMRNEMQRAVNKTFDQGHLHGLTEELKRINDLRKSAESCDPQSMATSMHMYRLDAYVEDLRCRIGLLQKQIGG